MHLKESSAYWVHEIVLSAQFPILSRRKGMTAWALTQPPFPGWRSLLRGWEHPRWTAALTGLSLTNLHESHKSDRCPLQNNESLLQNPPKKTIRSVVCLFTKVFEMQSHWIWLASGTNQEVTALNIFSSLSTLEPRFRQGHASSQTDTQTRNQAGLFGALTLHLYS